MVIAGIPTASTRIATASCVIAHCIVVSVVGHSAPIGVAELFTDTLPDFSSRLTSQARSYSAPGWTAHCSPSSTTKTRADSAADAAANTLSIERTGKHGMESNTSSQR